MKADRDYDVVFARGYEPPALADFDESDSKIPEGSAPYYLRANTGPRWVAGGIMSRPFITTAQSSGKFAISSIESSKDYGSAGNIFSRFLTFKDVDHCFSVQEGILVIRLKGGEKYNVREGETAVIPAGQGFSLQFASRYVRVWTFTGGDGVEAIVHKVGKSYEGFVLPELTQPLDESKLIEVCGSLGVSMD